MNQPWLREVEVIIGSAPDWAQDPAFVGPLAKNPTPVALRVYSNGTQNHMRVGFAIRKHAVGTNSPSTIRLYNLSAELRNALMVFSKSRAMGGSQVILNVGWMSGDPGPNGSRLQNIYKGGLWAAWSQREGADIVTTLACMSELPAYRGTANMTVDPNTSLAAVVESLAQKIQGVTVSRELILIEPTWSIGRRGRTFIGHPGDILRDLSIEFGFSWHILDGVFEAAMDDNGKNPQAFMGTVIPVTNRNGFLLRAEPILVSPYQQQSGVSIHSLLNPLINPYRVVQLRSDMNPRLDGSYMAHTVNHTGDTFSNQWFTDIECTLVMPTVQIAGVQAVDATGVAFIAKEEGNVLHQYNVDGIPHIGVGHRLTALELKTKVININGVPVNYASGITNQQSLDLAKQDLARFEAALNKGIMKPLSQNQYNAMASIAYNGGEGVATGNLAQIINSGDYAKAGEYMLTYKITSEGTGQVSQALVNRRKREAALWNGNG